MADSPVTDLTRGVYRRLYAGFIKGRRINKLSLEAEAWFWRVMATADDFGNADAEAGLCFAATVGRRVGITQNQVEKWLEEMGESGLIQMYTDESGDKYLHIVGFEVMQPAGKNGKRVCRFPRPEESRLIQNNPDFLDASLASHSHSHSDPHSHSHSQTHTEKVAPAAKPRSPSKPKLCDEDYVTELQNSEAYNRLDVRYVLGKMVAWCENNGKQPTRARLLNWLNREDRPIAVSRTAVGKPSAVPLDLPPLPNQVTRWACGCGFDVLQNGDARRDCPDCGSELVKVATA